MKIVARGVIMVVSIVLLGGLGVPVAHADEVFSSAVVSGDEASRSLVVRSFKDLKNALAASCVVKMPVALGADIGTGEFRSGEILVGCSATLNLDGHTLRMGTIDIRAGQKFTVTDSTPPERGAAGMLDVRAARHGLPGIRITNAEFEVAGRAQVMAKAQCGAAGIGTGISERGGKVTVSGAGARVAAYGGTHGAGIGGGFYGPGNTVIVSGSGASIEAYGGDSAAGIGGGMHGAGATVTVTGAEAQVTAQAGSGSAGIGGGAFGAGGTLTVSGSGARVVAHGLRGAGVGGGNGQPGGEVMVGRGATLIASSAEGSAVGRGALHNSYADPDAGVRKIDGDLVIASGKLIVESGVGFEVGEFGRVLGVEGSETSSAQIVGNGTIVNRGTIALEDVDSNTGVKEHNFHVYFVNGAEVHVTRAMGATFATAFRHFPAAPVGMEWRTSTDNSGIVVTEHTQLQQFAPSGGVVLMFLVGVDLATRVESSNEMSSTHSDLDGGSQA